MFGSNKQRDKRADEYGGTQLNSIQKNTSRENSVYEESKRIRSTVKGNGQMDTI